MADPRRTFGLNEYPKGITPFENLNVNWSKTKVWSEGGYYARLFFNMQGREPQGVVPASEYESFQNEMKARLESLPGENTQTMKSLVFKPQEIYRNVRNVAPDLIVHFGELYWRSIGTVGHAKLHVQENDTGPDGCNHAQYGMFILTAPNCPLSGEYEGAQPAGHRAHFIGSRRLRNSRDDARTFAGGRDAEEGARRRSG